jgi:hypothetical protein
MTYLSLLFISAAALFSFWLFRRHRKKSDGLGVNNSVELSTAASTQTKASTTMVVREKISSLEQFDQLLSEEYRKFVTMFPEKPTSFVQRRFSQCGIFPKPGWGLIEYGESAALSGNDPELLYGALCRFQRCAHAQWGHPDERGLHSGGYDFCTLVVPALYSSLLGKSYLEAAFPSTRTMSKASHPAYMHTANIMLCIDHEQWSHAEKAKDRARSFVAAKSTSKVDGSFVTYFLSILNGDAEAAARALVDFSKGYERSDWGKHKPGTRATFVQSLVTYAGYYTDSSAIKNVLQDLLSDQQLELWDRFYVLRDSFSETDQLFHSPLDFLNDMSFCVFPADDR